MNMPKIDEKCIFGNVEYLILNIPKGHARFIHRIENDTKAAQLMICASDKETSVGKNASFPEDETWKRVISIRLETPEQAESYAEVFKTLAQKMRDAREEYVDETHA